MYNEIKMVQIAINKSLLKEYSSQSNDRIVYLDNNSEFQLQFVNPTSERVAAEISINGKAFTNRLILRPGERCWLDRFLDNPNKFKFETFETAAGLEAATQNNGLITVKFYRETELKIKTYDPGIYITTAPTTPTNPWQIPLGSNVTLSTSAASYYTSSSSESCVSALNGLVTDTTSNVTLKGISPSITTSACCSKSEAAATDITETGRIEQGSRSSQRIDQIREGNYEYIPFNTESIKILPISQKPICTNDLKKIYCPECGRKMNDKYKFCPYCGTDLNK